jgi:hypothetical protein
MRTGSGDGGWGRSRIHYSSPPVRGDGRWIALVYGTVKPWTGRGCWYRPGVIADAGAWSRAQFTSWAFPGSGWWSGNGSGYLWWWL